MKFDKQVQARTLKGHFLQMSKHLKDLTICHKVFKLIKKRKLPGESLRLLAQESKDMLRSDTAIVGR